MEDICQKGVSHLLHEEGHGVCCCPICYKQRGRKVLDIRGFHSYYTERKMQDVCHMSVSHKGTMEGVCCMGDSHLL